MNKIVWMCGIAAATFAASSSQAAVICLGNCAAFDENVLITTNDVASPTVNGLTNTTNASVLFTSNELAGLLGPSNGAARVEAADGTLNSLKFELLNGYSFTSAVWNLNGADANTTVTITYFTPGAVVYNTSYLLGANGNNFMGITADAGERISAVSFSLAGGGFHDLRQLRLGGVGLTPPPVVPEPASWALMIAGFAMVGATMRRKTTSVAFA